MKLHISVIANMMGALIAFIGVFLLCGVPIALYYQDGGLLELFIPGLVALAVGGGLWVYTEQESPELSKRDGYLIVTLGWVVISLLGALPYYFLGGQFDSFASAFFESVSGFTTTGASVLTDIEAQPKAILFWRSLTHWIGGMGIIVLVLAILPLLGIGGMQLFVAEAPGPSADKLHPRITETAKRLWIIYMGITVVQMILLMLCGLSFYDAITHAFATVSTGGFSTKNASVGAFSPIVHYIIIFFMFISGVNFSLTYFGLKGKLHKMWESEEFRVYLFLTLAVTLLSTVVLWWNDPRGQDITLEASFRHSLFQVVAVITTTGFATENYALWGLGLKTIFFLLMFVGGSSGSTSGGMKIVRHIVVFKNGWAEFKRQLHPSAIIPVRYNKKAIESSIVFNILAFFLIYMSIYAMGCFVLGMMSAQDFETTISAVATSLGNVGPGLGAVDPSSNFSIFGAAEKYFLSFLMLLGRLELFTILILFTPFFWKKV